MDKALRKYLINRLEEYVTPNKVELIAKVLAQRTRKVTVVIEDFYHPHNASAVMRTCDCFGIQDVYITQNLHEYNVNPNVVRGASKWLTIKKFEREATSTQKCFDELKAKNYRLIGTSPDPSQTSIRELDVAKPLAFVFGTEKDGISDFARDNVDELVHIPMYGFTESFNVSVSAALLLNEMVHKLRSLTNDWNLTEVEREELTFEWYKQIVKRSDLHIENFIKEHSLRK